MFQTFFPSIIRSSKLHIQRQVFVRPLLLTVAGLARLAAGSSNGLTNTWRCMCSFELLMMDGKTRLKHAERLTEINKLWIVASLLVVLWKNISNTETFFLPFIWTSLLLLPLSTLPSPILLPHPSHYFLTVYFRFPDTGNAGISQ